MGIAASKSRAGRTLSVTRWAPRFDRGGRLDRLAREHGGERSAGPLRGEFADKLDAVRGGGDRRGNRDAVQAVVDDPVRLRRAAHRPALARDAQHVEQVRDLAARASGLHQPGGELFLTLPRMVTGQHRGVSPRYLSQYAREAAWKEDLRRMDNGALACRSLGLGLAHGVSRAWKGYWQRVCAA